MKKALLSITLGLAAATAMAAWPSKTVTLVVPFPPGGSTDMIARIISSQLGAKIGGTVVVDNKPGATGTIGAAFVARAQPDGLTLLGTTIGPQAIAIAHPSRSARTVLVATDGVRPFALQGQ